MPKAKHSDAEQVTPAVRSNVPTLGSDTLVHAFDPSGAVNKAVELPDAETAGVKQATDEQLTRPDEGAYPDAKVASDHELPGCCHVLPLFTPLETSNRDTPLERVPSSM